MTEQLSSEDQSIAAMKELWSQMSEDEQHNYAVAVADDMSREEAIAFVARLKKRGIV